MKTSLDYEVDGEVGECLPQFLSLTADSVT